VFVADEYTVTMNWLYSNAIGGVKLQVKEDDVEQAMAVLAPHDQEQEPVEQETDDLEDDPTCPNCGSLDISYERYSMRWVFASWAFSGLILTTLFGALGGFPLPFLKREWYCRACDYRWKQFGSSANRG
jgi:rubredoxin